MDLVGRTIAVLTASAPSPLWDYARSGVAYALAPDPSSYEALRQSLDAARSRNNSAEWSQIVASLAADPAAAARLSAALPALEQALRGAAVARQPGQPVPASPSAPGRGRTNRFIVAAIVAVIVVAAAVSVPLILTGRDSVDDAQPAVPLRWTRISTSFPTGFVGMSVDCPDATTCIALVRGNRGQGIQVVTLVGGEVEATATFSGDERTMDQIGCVTAVDCWGYSNQGVWHWDGTRWSANSNEGMFGMDCLPGQFCVFLSYDSVYRTDGASLVSIGTFDHSPTSVACSAADSCLALSNYAAWRYDGTSWTSAVTPTSTDPSGNLRVIDLSCASGSDVCVAAADWTLAVSNADSWTMRPTTADARLDWESVECVSPRACLAVGAAMRPSDGSWLYDDVAVAMWDGTAWTESDTSGVEPLMLESVACTAPTDCYATGYTGWANGTSPDAEAVILHGTPV